MPAFSILLTRQVSDHLDEICQRLNISSAQLLGLILARLTDVDRMWRSGGMAGVTPNRLPDALDPDQQEPETVWLVVEVSDDIAKGYGDICSRLSVSPEAFLTMMAGGLVDQDVRLVSKGREGLGTFRPPGYEDYALEMTVEHGIYPATGDIRPSTRLVWPADKSFPLTDAQCAALVRGHMVRWGGTVDEYLTELPGKYELVDGFLLVYET